jgi:hypothetical protein
MSYYIEDEEILETEGPSGTRETMWYTKQQIIIPVMTAKNCKYRKNNLQNIRVAFLGHVL